LLLIQAFCLRQAMVTALKITDTTMTPDELVSGSRVARVFFLQHTKTGKKLPKTSNIPNDHKVYQIAVK
jgi:hypothetical protein